MFHSVSLLKWNLFSGVSQIVSGQAFYGLAKFAGLEGINERMEPFDLLLWNNDIVAFLEERHKVEAILVGSRVQSQGNIGFPDLNQAGSLGVSLGGFPGTADP
jgi:hypothetical protein